MAENSHTGKKIQLPRNSSLCMMLDTPKGRGVFAGRKIDSGSVVDTCPVLVLGQTENVKHIEKTSLYHYTFNWVSYAPSGNTVKTQAIVFGLGSMFNHSRNHQNIGWKRDVDNQLIIYYALRDINEGEELCISYGDRLTFEDVDERNTNGISESAEDHLTRFHLP